MNNIRIMRLHIIIFYFFFSFIVQIIGRKTSDGNSRCSNRSMWIYSIYNQLRFSHNASELSFCLHFLIILLHVLVSNDISPQLQVNEEKTCVGRVSKLHFQNSKNQNLYHQYLMHYIVRFLATNIARLIYRRSL